MSPLLESPFLFILYALAAMRVTRLITTDTVAEPIRLLFSRTDLGREFIHCPWCVGFWISLVGVVLVTLAHPHIILTILILGFAVSEVVGLLSTMAMPDDDDE